jgi:hypothetical protein
MVTVHSAEAARGAHAKPATFTESLSGMLWRSERAANDRHTEFVLPSLRQALSAVERLPNCEHERYVRYASKATLCRRKAPRRFGSILLKKSAVATDDIR